jgi:N-acetylmuramoyl-L-alanine amidase
MAAAALLLLLTRCASAPVALPHATIVVCGQPQPIRAVVVGFDDTDGYSAYRQPDDGKPDFAAVRGKLPAAIAERAATAGLQLADLQQVVHQFVLHYDVAGTSRSCFKTLQQRNLSVHFLLDVDGTIYQTLDLKERAFHATIANDGSIGVEIAHPGAWRQPMNADMVRWYGRDERGWFMKTPAWMQDPGFRTKDFVARPDRPDIIEGTVQGEVFFQLDFTPQQYAALAQLCAALHRVFPRIRLEVPRAVDGSVVDRALPAGELAAFDGIVGHFHVQQTKNDPGPAMQWDRLLQDARAALANLPE